MILSCGTDNGEMM